MPNTTAEQFEQVALKWNIHPGMKPIRWHIMDTVLAPQQDPSLQPDDVVSALKRGIKGWNAVFGLPVFEAVVGGRAHAAQLPAALPEPGVEPGQLHQRPSAVPRAAHTHAGGHRGHHPQH
ncbi:hypothetical protein [Myxococcus sp. NMCA1]|uniref:hypothetical protein n=1 Tax=Myxococcus sp. NMCA1 TaxID=2996785 RepID=UPI0022866A70|nr:hypothetical protein [Myxococcus sp. NMCA1]WAM28651.1 hypothetical protein OZ403_11295 [Myxococcus sp. NMCA1]